MSELMHYGTPRHSGRYPWGSGKNPQRNKNIITRDRELKAKGFTEAERAKAFGMTTTQLRAAISIASNELKKENIDRAKKLKEKGYSNTKIGEMMGYPDTTIGNWLRSENKPNKKDSIHDLADVLRKQVAEKGYIDVGKGVELSLNTTHTKLETAIAILEQEGYTKTNVQVNQLGTGDNQKTLIKVLAPPGTTYKDVNMNQDKIRSIEDYTQAGSENYSKLGLPPIKSISSDRIKIVYAEDGGTAKDGVIELRRGLEDLNLGNANYAQVRIPVDGTHYLKGMAIYSDNMPPGVDVLFNTNKHNNKTKLEVMKPMKTDAKGNIDPDNPFGASIKSEDELKRVPRYYTDKDGKRQVSPINVVNEEGDWGNWSKNIASQMLSKQPLTLAKRQLDLSYEIKRGEFESIMAVDNPVVKKKLLEGFASDCDSQAVHLKAAALPRQATHVILPLDKMKETEIFAPRYNNGEQVALIRYPHGGTFEIPILTVNNKNKAGNSIIGNTSPDAVGINAKVAERLSGADFDGDTVLVIPTGGATKIKSTPALEGLKGFDPKAEYAIDRSDPAQAKIKRMTEKYKQNQMGVVSNLITDMTLNGAKPDELARAVRHSMVVIDSEKHDLDYRRSEKDNRIEELKRKYQVQENGKTGGAATIISRAKSTVRLPRREEIGWDPDTGEVIYRNKKNDTYLDEKGRVQTRKEEYHKMSIVKDANELVSVGQYPMERAYAKYANQLKSLANEARKAYLETPNPKRDPKAAKAYSNEVASLENKLNIALKNAPRERQAQLAANKVMSMKKEDNPSMDKDTEKKLRSQALASARARLGAKKESVKFTEREWEAVQARAISSSKLSQILNNADLDQVKKLATPRERRGLTSAQEALAKSMKARGYTLNEIADRFDVSSSTIESAVN